MTGNIQDIMFVQHTITHKAENIVAASAYTDTVRKKIFTCHEEQEFQSFFKVKTLDDEPPHPWQHTMYHVVDTTAAIPSSPLASWADV